MVTRLPYSGEFSQMAPKMKIRRQNFADAGHSRVLEQRERLNSQISFSQMLGQLRNLQKFCPAKTSSYTVVL